MAPCATRLDAILPAQTEMALLCSYVTRTLVASYVCTGFGRDTRRQRWHSDRHRYRLRAMSVIALEMRSEFRQWTRTRGDRPRASPSQPIYDCLSWNSFDTDSPVAVAEDREVS